MLALLRRAAALMVFGRPPGPLALASLRRTFGARRRTTHNEQGTTNNELRTTNYELRTTNYELRTTIYFVIVPSSAILGAAEPKSVSESARTFFTAVPVGSSVGIPRPS